MKSSYIFLIIVSLLLFLGFLYFVAKEKGEDLLVEESDHTVSGSVSLPQSLIRVFPDTDWLAVDSSVEKILSGGPGKDGIPAIDDPKFEPVSGFAHPDGVLAIVMEDEGQTKVYPYNILTWHEIVNDVVNGVPIAVTFCPLCGSAIVFERDLPLGISTFGVSGFLIESNMVMYDRETESLWQQSTGRAIAGEYFGEELPLAEFQLMTMGEVKERFPEARVLSEDTGYRRDYARNPYAGYEDSDRFIFSPSDQSDRYHSKEIFVVFRFDETVVGAPWLALDDGQRYEFEVNDQPVTLLKQAGELNITDSQSERIPFYFEMWFSFYVQHKDGVEIFDPRE